MAEYDDAEERGQLIPQLPEELVLAHVIPRLPWYTRPLCRALSKSWRAILDTRNQELDRRTCIIQLPLLRDLFLFCTFDKQIFIRDHHAVHGPFMSSAYQIQPGWRKLPPWHYLLAIPSPAGATMLASAGMVYVWSDHGLFCREGPNCVLKLDMGRADWRWTIFPVPYAFNFDTTSFNGTIYVPNTSIRSSTDPSSEKKVVFAHDMITDKCRQVETWNQDNLSVLFKCAHSPSLVEEMYSFVEQEIDRKLEVLMYDVESDSWGTREEVPIPEVGLQAPEVRLLNSDCFEPAPDLGINIVSIDHESELIYWFNSYVRNSWTDIDYSPVLEGKFLDYIQFMRGSIYGIFCDEQGEEDAKIEEDGGVLSGLFRRVLMKGKIIVSSSSVAWEEVHEIGFFEETYPADSAEIRAIDWYTLMV